MTSLPMASSPRVLEPIDRISEVLFGLIMVLSFTGSLSVAEAGREDVKTMLVGALGCNLAWGLIDAIFYLMGCIAEHGRNLATFRAVKHAPNERLASRIVADALPPIVSSLLDQRELDDIRARLQRLPEPDGAGGRVAQRRQRVEFEVDFGEARADGVDEPLAGIGGRDAAGRAREEAQAEACLELADGVAQCRLRDAELGCGAGETALAGDGEESFELVGIGAHS